MHCVIPSPSLDMKNAPRISEGEHYVGLMDLTGEAEFETGLRSSLSCSRCSFSPPLFISHPSLSIHLPLIPPCFSPLESLCSLLPFQSTTATTVSVPAKNRLFRVKVSFI